MQRITPCLWFNTEAEEAMRFYSSIFNDGKILDISYYGPNMPMPEGTVLVVNAEFNGQRFMALNSGPGYPFSEAVSFSVDCKDQAEVDYYWEKLGAGGNPVQCGWLTDKFGLSWQIVPTLMTQILTDPDKAKVQRVMQAMMQMVKLDVAVLEKAARGD